MKMLVAGSVDSSQVVWTVTAALAFENTMMSMKDFTAIGILLFAADLAGIFIPGEHKIAVIPESVSRAMRIVFFLEVRIHDFLDIKFRGFYMKLWIWQNTDKPVSPRADAMVRLWIEGGSHPSFFDPVRFKKRAFR